MDLTDSLLKNAEKIQLRYDVHQGKSTVKAYVFADGDEIKRVSRLVRNANGQFKKCSLETEYALPEEFKKFRGRGQRLFGDSVQ